MASTTSDPQAAPPTATQESPIMTIDEVAAGLRLNRKTLYALARNGEIPVRRVGRSLRAHRETVLKWLSESQVPVSRKRRNP
jgi:excisionase family DNA binding protein